MTALAHRYLAALFVASGLAASLRAGEDPHRLDELAKLPLDVKTLKDSVAEGIRVLEVEFTSEIYRDRPVRIFAVYAMPAQPSGKLPGILWSQSGLYRASDHFPVLLARRGYGCISIDAPFQGYRSTAVAGYDVWHIGNPVTDHSAVRLARALHRAVTFLASRAEIDPSRIGAAGSSWGGYASFLIAGLDERLKAVSTFFGCGNLLLGCAWEAELAKLKGGDLERWRQLYDPAARLPQRKNLAVMITTGTNDGFYRVPAVNKTYLDAPGDKRLAWIPNYNHLLSERGDEMVLEFLDHQFRSGSGGFNRVEDAAVANRGGKLVIRFASRGPRRVASAAVHFSVGPPGNWVGRLWAAAAARQVEGGYEAEIPVLRPELPLAWFASVTDATGAFIGTDIRFANPRQLGIAAPTAEKVDANGCFFGDFEPDDITYLTRAGQRLAPVETMNPHTGKQCLKLVADKADLLFSTDTLRWWPAFPAELSAWTRGTGAAVELALDGKVDGADVRFAATQRLTNAWQRLWVNTYAFKAESSGELRFTVRVPKGATVWLDSLRFRPLTSPKEWEGGGIEE